MTPSLESPGLVRTSLAGAIELGLARGRFAPGVRCSCLNLLLVYADGCRAACSYCGLGRTRRARPAASDAMPSGGRGPAAIVRQTVREHGDPDPTFIRVSWPVYELGEILTRAAARDSFARICVSMITHPRALVDTLDIIARCRTETSLPVSALVAPTLLRGASDFERLREAGADRIGIAIDAATEELFGLHRGAGVAGPHRWSRYWRAVDEAAAVFGPERVGIHMMVGLGESELQMLEVMLAGRDRGVAIHLFSFYPEDGSPLEQSCPPPLDTYRRLQVARFLLAGGLADRGSFTCRKGRITDFGLDLAQVEELEQAFMTSGCPGADGRLACNRPFGNERPSGPLRNHPTAPEDPRALLAELELP